MFVLFMRNRQIQIPFLAALLLASLGLAGCTSIFDGVPGQHGVSESRLKKEMAELADDDPFPTSSQSGIR